MSTDTTTEAKKPAKATQIPPRERIAVDASTAAALMSCSRSTFFKRVKDGLYPKAGPDGLWSVSQLLALHQASRSTTA